MHSDFKYPTRFPLRNYVVLYLFFLLHSYYSKMVKEIKKERNYGKEENRVIECFDMSRG